jgi:hypothetical protein
MHRTTNALKDHLNAPVVFDAEAGGYRYGRPETGEAFELPGLWFTAHELKALALVQRLIKDAGGGLLEEHFGASQEAVARVPSPRKDEITEREVSPHAPSTTAKRGTSTRGTRAKTRCAAYRSTASATRHNSTSARSTWRKCFGRALLDRVRHLQRQRGQGGRAAIHAGAHALGGG